MMELKEIKLLKMCFFKSIIWIFDRVLVFGNFVFKFNNIFGV